MTLNDILRLIYKIYNFFIRLIHDFLFLYRAATGARNEHNAANAKSSPAIKKGEIDNSSLILPIKGAEKTIFKIFFKSIKILKLPPTTAAAPRKRMSNPKAFVS